MYCVITRTIYSPNVDVRYMTVHYLRLLGNRLNRNRLMDRFSIDHIRLIVQELSGFAVFIKIF